MPTRNVVLTNKHEQMIERLVADGRYQNASEVLRDGLRLIEDREREDEIRLAALREALKLGFDDLEAGRYQDFHTREELARHINALTKAALADDSR